MAACTCLEKVLNVTELIFFWPHQTMLNVRSKKTQLKDQHSGARRSNFTWIWNSDPGNYPYKVRVVRIDVFFLEEQITLYRWSSYTFSAVMTKSVLNFIPLNVLKILSKIMTLAYITLGNDTEITENISDHECYLDLDTKWRWRWQY